MMICENFTDLALFDKFVKFESSYWPPSIKLIPHPMFNTGQSYGLRTHPYGGAPDPWYAVFHTQTVPPGVGDHLSCAQCAGWGITLVDGGQSGQRDKQYAPTCVLGSHS